MVEFSANLRGAARQLTRAPLLTLTVVGTMALAIGAATVVFSIVNGELLTPLPFRSSDRLFGVVDHRLIYGRHPNHLSRSIS